MSKVNKLVVAVNKMDDCDWSEERYKECTSKLLVFLKGLGCRLSRQMKPFLRGDLLITTCRQP
jgi:translation elongation factor EF-1alpha